MGTDGGGPVNAVALATAVWTGPHGPTDAARRSRAAPNPQDESVAPE